MIKRIKLLRILWIFCIFNGRIFFWEDTIPMVYGFSFSYLCSLQLHYMNMGTSVGSTKEKFMCIEQKNTESIINLLVLLVWFEIIVRKYSIYSYGNQIRCVFLSFWKKNISFNLKMNEILFGLFGYILPTKFISFILYFDFCARVRREELVCWKSWFDCS